MAADDSSETTEPLPPWFADRSVDVLEYRINRRPRAQGSLFSAQPEPFIDHLTEVLLFGHRVSTRKNTERRWLLGNRRIGDDERFVAGVIGWESEEVREEDYFDETTATWVPTTARGSRVVLAPFVIVASTRVLHVVKHATFAETTIATVFRTILNAGEEERSAGPSTDWDVQPLLDEVEFEDWLREIAVLQKVTFVAKIPNPDAEDAFAELDQHLRNMRAGEMRHSLKAADPEAGLSTNLEDDPLAHGLLEMSKRGYANVSALATDAGAKVRRFVQKNRTKRNSVLMTAKDLDGGRDELAQRGLAAEDSGDG